MGMKMRVRWALLAVGPPKRLWALPRPPMRRGLAWVSPWCWMMAGRRRKRRRPLPMEARATIWVPCSPTWSPGLRPSSRLSLATMARRRNAMLGGLAESVSDGATRWVVTSLPIA